MPNVSSASEIVFCFRLQNTEAITQSSKVIALVEGLKWTEVRMHITVLTFRKTFMKGQTFLLDKLSHFDVQLKIKVQLFPIES